MVKTHSSLVISVSFLASPAATLRGCCGIGVELSMNFKRFRARGIRAVETACQVVLGGPIMNGKNQKKRTRRDHTGTSC